MSSPVPLRVQEESVPVTMTVVSPPAPPIVALPAFRKVPPFSIVNWVEAAPPIETSPRTLSVP